MHFRQTQEMDSKLGLMGVDFLYDRAFMFTNTKKLHLQMNFILKNKNPNCRELENHHRQFLRTTLYVFTPYPSVYFPRLIYKLSSGYLCFMSRKINMFFLESAIHSQNGKIHNCC